MDLVASCSPMIEPCLPLLTETPGSQNFHVASTIIFKLTRKTLFVTSAVERLPVESAMWLTQSQVLEVRSSTLRPQSR
jgi:hypothetical protein